MEQLQSIKAKLNGVDHSCNELRLAIDEMQAYSYETVQHQNLWLAYFRGARELRVDGKIMYTVVSLNGSQGCLYAKYRHSPRCSGS